MKNKSSKNTDVRQKIIAAAVTLFAANGYASTSVDRIAAEANISKGLVYYYFKSKTAILAGIFTSLLTASGMLLEKGEGIPPHQFLKGLIENSFRLVINHTNHFRLLMALMIQPDVASGLTTELETIRHAWLADLVKVFEALGYQDPETEAYVLIALFDGVGLAYLSMPDYPITDIRNLVEKKYHL